MRNAAKLNNYIIEKKKININTNNISDKPIDVGHNGTLYIQERIKYAQIFHVHTGPSHQILIFR